MLRMISIGNTKTGANVKHVASIVRQNLAESTIKKTSKHIRIALVFARIKYLLRTKLDSVSTFPITLVLIAAKQTFASSNSTIYSDKNLAKYLTYLEKALAGPLSKRKSLSAGFAVLTVTASRLSLSIAATGAQANILSNKPKATNRCAAIFLCILVLIAAKQIFAFSNSIMYVVTRQLTYLAYSLKVEAGPSLRLKLPSVKFVALIATVSAPLSVMETG